MPLPVMIVVNELGIVYLFNPTLERFSFNMISFIDPLLALDHFTQYPRRYCLILVDMIIVNLNGQELAKEIRKYNFDVKILLITGYCKGDIRHSIDFKAAKISDVILKPVNFAILEPKILQLCSENKPASSNNKI